MKKYKDFKESIVIDLLTDIVDIGESLSIDNDSLLSSISATEMDIFDTFKLPKDEYTDKLDIQYLSDNIEFINSLSSIGLKKSTIQNSSDYELFINKPTRFMFIYNVESNELENPNYLLIQSYNESLKKWDNSKLYKVNGDVKKFYDKLSSKIIEVEDGGEKFIYSTSNGNEWTLQNVEKENDTFKKVIRKEDFEILIKDREVKIKII